jgi:hypothetical protein
MSKQMSLASLNLKISWTERIRGQFVLIVAYIMLRCFSLLTISKIVRVAKRFCYREINSDEANFAWQAVRQSNFILLGRVACLELSLAFVLFALTKGLSVVWCVGVNAMPFEAHSWIEVSGKPLKELDLDRQNIKKIFTV